jgi:hypothetical protein
MAKKDDRLHKADKVAMVPPNGKGLVRVSPDSVKRYEARGFRKEGTRKSRRAAPANTTKESTNPTGDNGTPKE